MTNFWVNRQHAQHRKSSMRQVIRENRRATFSKDFGHRREHANTPSLINRRRNDLSHLNTVQWHLQISSVITGINPGSIGYNLKPKLLTAPFVNLQSTLLQRPNNSRINPVKTTKLANAEVNKRNLEGKPRRNAFGLGGKLKLLEILGSPRKQYINLKWIRDRGFCF